MLVDSHCHLDFPGLAEQRPQVIARAQAAGVGVMQTIATRLSTFDGLLAIAEAEPGIFCSQVSRSFASGPRSIDDRFDSSRSRRGVPGELLARLACPL
jgi:TatD DNase family protein